MNNMLDSSSSLLNALALNYASFGVFTVVNNLWTWVAVITAAISFWKIRTTSFTEKPDRQSGSPSQPSAKTCVEPQAPSPSPSPAVPSVCDVKDVDGVTEGAKFTLYYCKEEERESDGEVTETVVKEWRDDAGDDDDDNGVSCCGEWWERATTRARIVDMGMGWYRYQDLTVVNGNVVRLWDDCRRRSQKSSCSCSLRRRVSIL